MAAEHGHYCVWHPTFSYEVINNRQELANKSSKKSSAVKVEQEEEDEDAGFWVWSNETQGLQYYSHAGAVPQIWHSGTGSGSSSSGSHGPPVNHSIGLPKKKAKKNHGQNSRKSPPLLHLNVLNTF